MNKNKHIITFKTNDGVDFPVEYFTYDGMSDYELWVSLPENVGKSYEEYRKAQRGKNSDFIVGCTTTIESRVEVGG